MGIISEDAVVIKEAEGLGGETIITISCPDKTGLGCDLSRVILLGGLNIARGVFWVTGKPIISWNLLRQRLLQVCPLCTPAASGIYYYRPEVQEPKPMEIFLLKFGCSYGWTGLLHDVAKALCKLELGIKIVKEYAAPGGKLMNFFYLYDTRKLLHTDMRQEETINRLKSVLGDAMISSETELAPAEVTACLPTPLPSPLTESTFSFEMYDGESSGVGVPSADTVSVLVDNNLSRSHTLLQISCRDQKGLIYDIMRTLKGYNYQVSYGRFFTNGKGSCEVDLFIMQDKKKILDPEKQNTMCARLRTELACPLRVDVFSRDNATEILVANPVELTRKGRPLLFYDITLVLKRLDIYISSVETGRHWVHDREWEVFRMVLDESDSSTLPRDKIKECVRNKLMGWDAWEQP
ncbi:PREDICTED: ACT domain-containing protein ACR10-like isoform X2 [Ipomoea nil]|uniref:ACT domain-containing protein ACR10-like isoform X2 n=1 Tax=Ipomoea nil TaxID=35883 RepID=UPI0009017D28|nr:PREDICTED: ACT domain-containing protein ACR10-like isoform X2 [Ipomoea nil]